MMDDEQLAELTHSLVRIAHAITPTDAMPFRDDDGMIVASLTEAVLSHAGTVQRVADALNEIALAIRESNDATS